MTCLTIATITLSCLTACGYQAAERAPTTSDPATTPATAPGAPPADSAAVAPDGPRSADQLADEIIALERKLGVLAPGPAVTVKPMSVDRFDVANTKDVGNKSYDSFSIDIAREQLQARREKAWQQFFDKKYIEEQMKIQSVYGPIGMADEESLSAMAQAYGDPEAGTSDNLFGRTLQAANASGVHVVALIHQARLRPRSGGYEAVRRTVGEEARLCPNDLFVRATELSLSRCSGVIIGPDRILTAKHCLTREFADDVDQIRIVVDYKARDPAPKFPLTDVFKVKVRQRGDRDWVILELTEGRRFKEHRIPRRDTRRPAEESHVYAVHHPLGMRRMASYNATIARYEDGNLVTNLDVLVGSSGCPVFSAPDGLLIGILLKGPEDLVPSKAPDGSECQRIARRADPETGAPGEHVLALHFIADKLDL